MKQLHWNAIDAAALAELLRNGTVGDSRAVGGSTVYPVQSQGRELLAISLPGGDAIVVHTAIGATQHRRSHDREEPAPPS